MLQLPLPAVVFVWELRLPLSATPFWGRISFRSVFLPGERDTPSPPPPSELQCQDPASRRSCSSTDLKVLTMAGTEMERRQNKSAEVLQHPEIREKCPWPLFLELVSPSQGV